MSAPLVLKFGGASLATPHRLRLAAERIAFHRRNARPVVAVVSAQGKTTDRILSGFEVALGGEEGTPAAPTTAREIDRALATGEDHAAALLAALLCRRGVPARSLRGGEAGIEAEGSFGEGRPRRLDPGPLRALLGARTVPVVAGYQALRPDGETITLGRGGSDLTAVLLAAEFGAEECVLVKDVPGIFDRDPARSPGAVLRPLLAHAEAVELARGGAAVLQLGAAELARERRIALRVIHYADPFGTATGTLVRDFDPPRAAPPAREAS